MAIVWHTNTGHKNDHGIFSLSENNKHFLLFQKTKYVSS